MNGVAAFVLVLDSDQNAHTDVRLVPLQDTTSFLTLMMPKAVAQRSWWWDHYEDHPSFGSGQMVLQTRPQVESIRSYTFRVCMRTESQVVLKVKS